MTSNDLDDELVDIAIARKKFKDADIHFEINHTVWQPVKRTRNDPNGFEVVFDNETTRLCKKIVSSAKYVWRMDAERDLDKVVNDLRRKRFKIIGTCIVTNKYRSYSFVIHYVNDFFA